MKGIHIFCASQSSTASTLDGEEQVAPAAAAGSLSSSSSSSSSSSIINDGRGPAIDRYNPIIHDQTRLLLLNPHLKIANDNNISFFKINNNNKDPDKKKKKHQQEEKRRSNAATLMNEDDDVEEDYAKKDSSSSIIPIPTTKKKNWSIKGRRSWSCMNPGAFITPPSAAAASSSSSSSCRFLLSDKTLVINTNNLEPPLPFQVVVLRVSLHCRGCEKKLRKHISTMPGVSSYNIEFAAKKVTVEGNVTPLGVLASISKVKNAQLWFPVVDLVAPPAPAPTPSPSPAPPQTISEINNVA